MTYSVKNIQRVRAAIEPNGSLGTDHTGTIGDFFDCPFIENVEVTLDVTEEESKYLRQERDDHSIHLFGPRKAKLTGSIPLFLPDARNNEVAALAPTSTMQLLRAYFGGYDAKKSDHCETGTTASVLIVHTAASFAEGRGVALADTSGVLHHREVVKVNSSSMTLDLTLPFTPAADDTIYMYEDWYLGNQDTDDVTTYQMIVEGGNYATDTFALYGGQCTTAITIEAKTGTRPMIKFAIEFANWEQKIALTSGISTVSYTGVQENYVMDSSFRAWAIATDAPGTSIATPAPLYVTDFTFDLTNFKYTPIKSPNGVQTIAAYIVSGDTPKAKGTFKFPWDSADNVWFDARDDATLYQVQLQIGSSETTGSILIVFGTVQIINVQVKKDSELTELEITWVAKSDVMSTTNTSALARSPVKIHVC
jgi:hypothetical protein